MDARTEPSISMEVRPVLAADALRGCHPGGRCGRRHCIGFTVRFFAARCQGNDWHDMAETKGFGCRQERSLICMPGPSALFNMSTTSVCLQSIKSGRSQGQIVKCTMSGRLSDRSVVTDVVVA